jgi:hypothetical protein
VQIPFVSGEPLLEDHESLDLTDIHQVIVGGQMVSPTPRKPTEGYIKIKSGKKPQEEVLLKEIQHPTLQKKKWISRRNSRLKQARNISMNITTDAKQTIYLEDIPVGRLVYEGQEHVFYVPCDGGFSQRLLPLIYNLAEPDRFSTSGRHLAAGRVPTVQIGNLQ